MATSKRSAADDNYEPKRQRSSRRGSLMVLIREGEQVGRIERITLAPVLWIPLVFDDAREANALAHRMHQELSWSQGKVRVPKKGYVDEPRKTVLMSTSLAPYRYSGKTMTPLQFPDWVLPLLERARELARCDELDTMLFNLYRDGSDSVSMHSDDEPSLVPNAPIVSFSFGADRFFDLDAKDGSERFRLRLENNTGLIMGPGCQQAYRHGVPKATKDPASVGWRINCTARATKRDLD